MARHLEIMNAPETEPPTDPKQLRFCEVYLASIDRDPTACALQVWPDLSEAQARSKAGQLMRPAHRVGAYIRFMLKQFHQDLLPSMRITESTIVGQIARLAFANVKQLYGEDGRMLEPHELSDTVAAAVTEVAERVTSRNGTDVVERRYKLADKSRNLEMLARYKQLFVDKSETNLTVVSEELERIISGGNEDDNPIPGK